jgi:hypothetical protein
MRNARIFRPMASEATRARAICVGVRAREGVIGRRRPSRPSDVVHHGKK